MLWAFLTFALVGSPAGEAGVIAARFNEVSPALAAVHFVARNESPSGGFAEWEGDLCGILVSADGLVVVPGTIRPDRKVRTTLVDISVTTTDGGKFTAAFLGKDSDLNLAFLKIRQAPAAGLPFLRFDPSATLEIGDPVIVFGILPENLESARRCEPTRISGVLTRPRRVLLATDTLLDNAGSPVVKLDGTVAGLVASPRLGRAAVSGTLSEEGLPSSVTPPCILPAAAFAKLIADPPCDEAPMSKPWIGIRAQPISPEAARILRLMEPDDQGFFVISRVFPDSPAARAGLREEDHVLACGGERLQPSGVEVAALLGEALSKRKLGEPVDLLVRRGEEILTISVSPEAAPKARDAARVIRCETLGLTVREATYFDLVERPAGFDRASGASGVVATTVDRAGSCGLAGVEAGDFVLKLDGSQIQGLDSFRDSIERLSSEHPREIVLFVLRGSDTHFVTVRPDWRAGG